MDKEKRLAKPGKARRVGMIAFDIDKLVKKMALLLVIFAPLGLWKLTEIIIYIFSHLSWE